MPSRARPLVALALLAVAGCGGGDEEATAVCADRWNRESNSERGLFGLATEAELRTARVWVGPSPERDGSCLVVASFARTPGFALQDRAGAEGEFADVDLAKAEIDERLAEANARLRGDGTLEVDG